VKHWQSGSMALRWTAVNFDAISPGFRRIMGYKHLWMLKVALGEPSKVNLLWASQGRTTSFQAGAATAAFH
jgi:hypothetical protein